MNRIAVIFTLALISTGLAATAQPVVTGAKTHMSIPHDHSPKTHSNAAVPHK